MWRRHIPYCVNYMAQIVTAWRRHIPYWVNFMAQNICCKHRDYVKKLPFSRWLRHVTPSVKKAIFWRNHAVCNIYSGPKSWPNKECDVVTSSIFTVFEQFFWPYCCFWTVFGHDLGHKVDLLVYFISWIKLDRWPRHVTPSEKRPFFDVITLHDRHSRTDINSGYKYPDPPGTLNYRETEGSNQVEVQIRVDKPSQHPQPSITEATVRDKQSNLNSAKVIKTRSLHNKKKPRAGGWEIKLKMQQEKPAASTGSQLLRVRRRHNNS